MSIEQEHTYMYIYMQCITMCVYVLVCACSSQCACKCDNVASNSNYHVTCGQQSALCIDGLNQSPALALSTH